MDEHYIYDVNMLILFPKVDCLSLENLLRKDTGGESVGFWFFLSNTTDLTRKTINV